MAKIYISSTYKDLADHRRHVYDILRKMRYDVIAMEDYVATDRRPVDQCLADVASCDVYVGIFAWRYGYIPPDYGKAITELEYRQAGKEGLERLIFLADEDAPWPRQHMDEVTGHGEGGARIEALRAELLENHMVQFFTTPQELASHVVASVAAWTQRHLDARMEELPRRRDQADQERRAQRERQRVVNLRPLDVTHTFKDRLREMQTLCEHLADSSVRLISVVGRGGMGKTALVSRVMADLEHGVLPAPDQEKELPIDGILYFSARSTSLERIYTDVGRMLGEPAASQLAARWADKDASLADKVEYLLGALRDGVYIILLDNLEDELTDEGKIADEGLRLFIQRCVTQPSGAQLIVTSRENIRLAGAALHGARSILLREGLPDEEAIALLRDLDPQGLLGLRDAPEDELRQAAQLTERIPRALEIVAGILQQDPTASLSRLLADEETVGAEVVEQLVAEGYRRLDHDEQRIMEALAVFNRPVEETAVAYLLHPWFPGLNVRVGLRRLVSGYFVNVSRVTGEYSLHPLDQEYAYRQLPEDEASDSYSQRNLELRAADFYKSVRKPESEWKTIGDLAPQLAEFEHRVRAGDYDGACRVLDPLDSDFLYRWGHYVRVVKLREQLLGRVMDRGLQAVNLGNLGNAYHALGQSKRAIECHEEALAIAREIGDRRGEAANLSSLGLAYRTMGQVKRAIGFYEQALAIAQEIGDRQGEGANLSSLGLAYHTLGQVEKAIESYEEALAIAREIDDRLGEGSRLGRLGDAYQALGQVDWAIRLHEEALALAREIGHRWGEEVNLSKLGHAYCTLGQMERAIELQQQALAIAREIDDRLGESYCLLRLGRALLAAGSLPEAHWRCEGALSLDISETSYLAALVLSIVFLRKGDEGADDAFQDTVTRCRQMLDKTPGLYEPRYTLAPALAGQAVCDPRWADEDQRPDLLAPALAEYRRALDICDAPGVVHDALQDLELIRAAGIHGLEPAFRLLESAVDTDTAAEELVSDTELDGGAWNT